MLVGPIHHLEGVRAHCPWPFICKPAWGWETHNFQHLRLEVKTLETVPCTKYFSFRLIFVSLKDSHKICDAYPSLHVTEP